MTLISILISLALEYFLGPLDRLRNYQWFDQYDHWLEMRCNQLTFWDGPAGVLLTLGIPLTILVLLNYGLGEISIILSFLFSTCIFIYSLGPDLNTLLNQYIESVTESEDDTVIQDIEHRLGVPQQTEDRDNAVVLETLLVRAHEYLFAIIFWFIVLGALGALLYCLVVRINDKFSGVHGGYGDAIRNLHNILMWPSARLLALGFALGGSLVDALQGWRMVEGYTLESSEEVISSSGLSAIQFQGLDADEQGNATDIFVGFIQEMQALVNRTLIVWLTALAVMTLGGWLG